MSRSVICHRVKCRYNDTDGPLSTHNNLPELRKSSYSFSHEYYAARNRVLKATLLLMAVAAAGTLGYYVLEDWSLLDSFYMTIITVATVGYGETNTLDTAGRLFTIGLIIVSVCTAGYGVSNLAAFVVEGEFTRIMKGRQMDKRLSKMAGHIILCGGGHTGKCIAQEFYKTRTPFVVIEKDPDVLEAISRIGDIPFIQGDGTEDEVLLLAGIQRAKGLATVLSDDKDNMFVVVTARALNSNLRIISRNIAAVNASKLLKAGADEVISPNAIGGMRIASSMIRPTMVQFLDAMLRDEQGTVRFHEIRVDDIPALVDDKLWKSDITKASGLMILAILHNDGRFQFNPDEHVRLVKSDTLLVMGSTDQIEKVKSVDFVSSALPKMPTFRKS